MKKPLREHANLAQDIQAQTGVLPDNENTRAFYAGIAEQERLGREAAEREQRAFDEMQNRLALGVRFLSNQLTDADMRDPNLKNLINQRSAALAAALRGRKQ